MRTRFARLCDHLRSTYWFLPTAMTAGAIALAFVTHELDTWIRPSQMRWMSWIWAGGGEGAREVLSIIAGSAITVVGVTFSITIVALTLASSQFGPRMLRNFMRDTGTQVVLGTFVATFTYCLFALRTVPETTDGRVVQVSVSVGVALAVLSLGVLIYFIHHVANSIQAEQLVSNVAEELHEAIDKMFPQPLGEPPFAEEDPRLRAQIPKTEPFPVRAAGRGYIQALDGDLLLQAAVDGDLIVRLERRPGDFVAEGDIVAAVWPAERCGPEWSGRVRRSFLLGRNRTQFQDFEYTLHQLVEIAVRALSAAFNDPFTAMACLDWLGSALTQIAGRELPSSLRADSQGRLRIIARTPPFADIADTSFNQIRQYGRRSVSVTLRLLTVIGRVAAHVVRPGDREALRVHADLVLRDAREDLTNENDRHEVELRYQETLRALAAGEANPPRRPMESRPAVLEPSELAARV